MFLIGGVLFFFYRFLLRELGPDRMGVWSLVLASVAMARVGDLGLGTTVARFLPIYRARGEEDMAVRYVFTALTSACVIALVVVPIAYALVVPLLGQLLPDPLLRADAIALLKPTLVAAGILMVGGVLQGALVGCQRADLSIIVQMFGTMSGALLASILLRRYGFASLGVAHAVQAVGQVIISAVLVRRLLPMTRLRPAHFDRSLLGGMLRYGGNLQVAGVAAIFFEPATKALLTMFGGLSYVTYFEMTNRLVLQLRNATSTAVSVVMPVVAEMIQAGESKIRELYEMSVDRVLLVGVPALSVVIAALPLISRLWVGQAEPVFILMGVIVALGWLANLGANPAYYWLIGLGNATAIAKTHVVQGASSFLIGLALGPFLGSWGVMAAWLVGLAGSSAFVWSAFDRRLPATMSVRRSPSAKPGSYLAIASALLLLGGSSLLAPSWLGTPLGFWTLPLLQLVVAGLALRRPAQRALHSLRSPLPKGHA